MKYKLLIFDWDGTLADTHPAVVRCMQQAAADLELPVPEVEHISDAYGLPLEDMVCQLFPTADGKIFQNKFYHYCLKDNNRDQLFDDALHALNTLQDNNYLMAIATNKERRALLASLNNLKLDHYFCALRCGDDGFAKPQPEVLHGILDELAVGPEHAVMIGDSRFDMLVAQNAKVDAIAICCNAQVKQELSQYNPIACINNISELCSYV